jgi:hypothetical protein
VGTLLLIANSLLLFWAVYQIDFLRQRVERLHVKVNAVRKAVAPDEVQGMGDREPAPVTGTIGALKHN